MAELVAAAVPELLRPEQAAQKYEEAVAVAVEKCAADTAGQTCYICYGEGDEDEGLVRGCSCRGENGFVHVSCLVRAAQVAVERGGGPGFDRWYTCGLCEQPYHGVVACALGWACWKTYLGRPETEQVRHAAMSALGNGLSEADHDEEALSVREAELSMMRRRGASECDILGAQNNLAITYAAVGREEQALCLLREVYSGRLKLNGEEHITTIRAANNYAPFLIRLQRIEEAKSLLLRMVPVARRVFGEGHDVTFRMRWAYAGALYMDEAATLEDLREAVTTLEETARTARRVLGSAHPTTASVEGHLRQARAALSEYSARARRVGEALHST